MNSFQQDSASNDVGRVNPNKSDKTRRTWSRREEDLLIAALKELVVNGWRSDNGFRAGYLGKLEEAIKISFPGTDLKGMPHIHSKISMWKKNYYSLSLILRDSGIGFNVDGKFMIDCTIEQWDDIVKRDPNARGMKKKSWPYLEDWKEIFGKDRATGTTAEDVSDAVHDMKDVVDDENDGAHGDYVPHFTADTETEGVADSVCQPEKGERAPRDSGKKRKANDGDEKWFNLLREMSSNANARMDCIASKLGYEQDLVKARNEVFDQINTMPTLTMTDKFDAYQMLAGDKQGLELFMGLPVEAKPQYVLHILMSRKL